MRPQSRDSTEDSIAGVRWLRGLHGVAAAVVVTVAAQCLRPVVPDLKVAGAFPLGFIVGIVLAGLGALFLIVRLPPLFWYRGSPNTFRAMGIVSMALGLTMVVNYCIWCLFPERGAAPFVP